METPAGPGRTGSTQTGPGLAESDPGPSCYEATALTTGHRAAHSDGESGSGEDADIGLHQVRRCDSGGLVPELQLSITAFTNQTNVRLSELLMHELTFIFLLHAEPMQILNR